MITLNFPLLHGPSTGAWRAVWHITGIPPNSRVRSGIWRVRTPAEKHAELVAYLQALALDLGYCYSPLDNFDK